MLILIGKNKTKPFKEIQNKLDNLSLAYRMKYTSDQPYLQEGSVIVKGEKDITEYIRELGEETRTWQYCTI